MNALYLAVAVFFTLFGDVTATETVCATTYFDGSTCNTLVCCDNGYSPCEEGCCSNVKIDPIPLTLIILGPLSLICSLALVAFVLKTVICTVLDNQDEYQSSKEVGM